MEMTKEIPEDHFAGWENHIGFKLRCSCVCKCGKVSKYEICMKCRVNKRKIKENPCNLHEPM